MDIVAVIVIVAILGIIGAVGGLFVREFGWQTSLASLTRTRTSSKPRTAQAVARPTPVDAAPAAVSTIHQHEDTRLREVRDDLRAAMEQVQAHETRLFLLEQGRAEVAEATTGLVQDQDAFRVELQDRLSTELHRLRLEMKPATDAGRGDRHKQRERRAETIAELYRRLARVDAAIAAVTNPILLPGEPLVVPTDFLAETLSWENWKEVGERAFALGEYFNQSRIHLDEEMCEAMTTCITTLRTSLTRSIYPNLQDIPTTEQLNALRAGLNEIGTVIPQLRQRLEGEYRALTTGADGATASER